MTAQQKRTAYRLLALFLAAGGGDAIIQFSTGTTYDWRHLMGVVVAAAILAGEKYLTESSSSLASPTVDAVNDALKPAMPTIVAGIAPTLTAVSTVPSRTVKPPSQSRAG